MAKPIAGKIPVSEGVTTVDLHVGAQTVKLSIEDAQELARELVGTAATLHDKIWAKGSSRPKA